LKYNLKRSEEVLQMDNNKVDHIEKEEDRKQFIPLFQRLLEYPEFVRAMEEN